MAEDERIRLWKLQLQQEMEAEEDDDDLFRIPPSAALPEMPDEPLSDEDVPSGPGHTFDDDLGLDLEEPAFKAKPPAHPTTFELPEKPVPPPPDRQAVITQATVASLQAQLQERDIEIARLKRSGPGAADDGRGDDMRDQKLRELAKKNRALVQALGKERAQNAALAGELASLRSSEAQKGSAAQQQAAGAGGSGKAAASSATASARGSAAERSAAAAAAARAPEEDGSQLRELREKLSGAVAKLHEARQAQQATRAELERYKRALAREVGEDTPLSKVLDEASGWRGRAQQITLLRAKLDEARRAPGGGGGEDDRPRNGADDKIRAQLASKEQERRREFERLLLREQDLQAERTELLSKLEAAAARIKILEGAARSGREKLKVLLTKSDNDDELISALKQQLQKSAKAAGAGSAAGGAGANSPEQRQAAEARAAATSQALDAITAEKEELVKQNERQEQIIVFLRDQLSRQSVVKETPQEMQQLQVENGKLRELCQLLQDKLARAGASTPS